MPSPITSVGDSTSGVCNLGLPCCPHARAGINTSHSPNVRVNSKFVHRLGDLGSCNCPHGGIFSSTSGSSSVRVNSIPVTRIADSTSCLLCGMPGIHISGSPNVRAGG